MYYIWHFTDIHTFIRILIHAHQVLMNLVRALYIRNKGRLKIYTDARLCLYFMRMSEFGYGRQNVLARIGILKILNVFHCNAIAYTSCEWFVGYCESYSQTLY